MDLVKQQLIVAASLPNDVSITSYDTSTWSHLNQWKGPLLSCDSMLYLSKWRSLIGANESKPMLHVWNTEFLGSKHPESRVVMPGHFKCMDLSRDETYCVACVKTTLYLWLVPTGDLVAVVHNIHFQEITEVLFLPDNERIVTASQDSRIKVFSVFQLINEKTIRGDCEPLFTLCGHTMPVTGLSCSKMDCSKNWLFSSSMDKTIKVWDVSFGQLLATFVLDSTPKCVLTDAILSCLYVGCSDGQIQTISMKPKETFKSLNMLTDSSNARMQGHSKEITCLELSIDDTLLFSASHDRTVKVWLLKNLQCLRTLAFESVVTNLKVSLQSTCDQYVYPREKLPLFSRSLIDERFAVIPTRNLEGIPLKRTISNMDEDYESKGEVDEEIDAQYKLKYLKSSTDDKFRDLFRKLAHDL